MAALDAYETDVFPTAGGDLRIYFFGHASLLFVFNGLNFYADPFSRVADFKGFPPADVVFLTHEHGDHLDPNALAPIRTPQTQFVLTETCARQISGGMVMHNGDEGTVKGVKIRAVPAYNLVHMREPGLPYHPKGSGNGYVLSFADCQVYLAGDTENIPEMKDLQDIDVAFLPMNLPYTMTPEMTAEAARYFHPAILYPYHYGDTDTSRLTALLANEPGIEVRIRKLA